MPPEGIAESLRYSWSKEFLEAGKKRLAATPHARPPRVRSRICAARCATKEALAERGARGALRVQVSGSGGRLAALLLNAQ